MELPPLWNRLQLFFRDCFRQSPIERDAERLVTRIGSENEAVVDVCGGRESEHHVWEEFVEEIEAR